MAEIKKDILMRQKQGEDIIEFYPITKWENVEDTPELASGIKYDGAETLEIFGMPSGSPSGSGFVYGLITGTGYVDLGFAPKVLILSPTVATEDDGHFTRTIVEGTIDQEYTYHSHYTGVETSDVTVAIREEGFEIIDKGEHAVNLISYIAYA